MISNYLDLENNIECLRERLNELMKYNYTDNYEDVLQVSVELDKLIYCYYQVGMEKIENKKH